MCRWWWLLKDLKELVCDIVFVSSLVYLRKFRWFSRLQRHGSWGKWIPIYIGMSWMGFFFPLDIIRGLLGEILQNHGNVVYYGF
jgi:hypothetical protein